MNRIILLAMAVTMLAGCPSLERDAYNTAVASKAFLDSIKMDHKECPAAGTTVCLELTKATAAKDVMIDALKVYCASATFDQQGGACTPPDKGTPSYGQVTAKLQSAIASYGRIASELRKAIQ